MTLDRPAVRAAVAVAGAHGIDVREPVLLQDGSNILIRLSPAPIVARVPAVTARWRRGDAWLAREVAVASFLHERGAPVVPPSGSIPPGPHAHDGHVMTFWEYAAPAGRPLDAREAGRRLRVCHEILRAYDADLPRHALLEEARALVDLLDLPEGEAERLRRAGDDVRARLDALDPELQPVHGDGDLTNVVMTAHGPLWNDWEDVCLAPIAWDLACLREVPEDDAHARAIAEAEDGYGVGDIDQEVLDACLAARRYQEDVWTVAFDEAGRSKGDGDGSGTT